MASIIIVFLAMLAIGMLVVLLQSFRQNRVLWSQVRQARRPVAGLLRDALVLWSPLALAIVVLAFAANRLGAASVSLTYRLTTLDEFCQVEGTRLVIACTGMQGSLARAAIRHAGVQADLDEFISRKYRAARQHWMALSADDLVRFAANRTAFYQQLSPSGVLSLESAPEDDPELVRRKRELLEVLRTPAPPARNLLDIVLAATERDDRVQRLRALTAQVLARREKVNQEAYASLSREQQARLWMRHRLAHLLATGSKPPRATIDSALSQLAAGGPDQTDKVAAVRRGILESLARDEAMASTVLGRDSTTRTGAAALYLALPMTRRCTVAAPDAQLRLRAADFADDAVADLHKLTQSNDGTFSCAAVAGAPAELILHSLGFEESVRRSIDRWHDDAARTSFRRLGEISLGAETTAADADATARKLALAVPTRMHLGRAECGLLHPGNCAANTARQAVEEAVARAQRDSLDGMQQVAASAAGASSDSVDRQVADTLLTLDGRIGDLRANAHHYAGRLFRISDLLRVLGWLAVALIAVKSFLYVLALELFHSDEELAIGFSGASPVEGEFRAARRLTIDRNFSHALITRKQLTNTDNNVCLAPWPWSSPLSRIFRGRYFLFTKGTFLADAETPGDPGNAVRGMVASAGGGLSMVEWIMKPGEEVIFRYKDFYGASENVELRSEISLRLSTLLLGRIVFHIARCGEGEGRLLLKANVEEIDQEHVRAIPPERMIAWNRHAQFTIHSGRTPWKTLVNGYTLVRRARTDAPSGCIVVSSDDAGSNLGSIRFVRRIFSAIF